MDLGHLAALEVTGRAVLLLTRGDAAWGQAGYATDAPYLTEACARWLAMVPGSMAPTRSTSMTSAMGDGQHSILLGVGIPAVEHLTGLARLPPAGFRFTAVPVPLTGAGTFPVRVYAMTHAREPELPATASRESSPLPYPAEALSRRLAW